MPGSVSFSVEIIQCPECLAFAPTAEAVKHAATCPIALTLAAVYEIKNTGLGEYSVGFVSMRTALKVVSDLSESMRANRAQAVAQVRAIHDRTLTDVVERANRHARRVVLAMAAGWTLSVVLAVAITLALCGRL